jgi:hypothetical protein
MDKRKKKSVITGLFKLWVRLRKGSHGRGGDLGVAIRRTLGTMVVMVLVFSGGHPATAQTEKWGEVFFQANQAYRAGNFREAAEGYHRLIEGGHGSGQIFFNLGNAYYRLDELGEAILNYERAKWSIPRDADLRFNLRHAKEQVIDAVAGDRGLLQAAFFWIHSVNLKELFWTFAAINCLFWAILIARRFSRSELLYYGLLFSVAFWLLAGISFGVKWVQVERDDRAVVVEEEINVLSGPDLMDTVLFKLHEGTIVNLERSEDGWSLVEISKDKRGWTAPGSILPVRPAVRP